MRASRTTAYLLEPGSAYSAGYFCLLEGKLPTWSRCSPYFRTSPACPARAADYLASFAARGGARTRRAVEQIWLLNFSRPWRCECCSVVLLFLKKRIQLRSDVQKEVEEHSLVLDTGTGLPNCAPLGRGRTACVERFFLLQVWAESAQPGVRCTLCGSARCVCGRSLFRCADRRAGCVSRH